MISTQIDSVDETFESIQFKRARPCTLEHLKKHQVTESK